MDIEESWVEIKDFPNYVVSNLGRVKNHKTGRVLKTTPNKGGYLSVKPCNEKRCVLKYVHQLVAFAFIGIANGLEINHIDGIKSHNSSNNLEYVTRSQNHKHAYDIGLRKCNGNVGKEKIAVKIIENGKRFGSISDLAKYINADPSQVAAAVRKPSRSVKGFTFEKI